MKRVVSFIEPLEARIAPAIFLVTTLADTVADDGELTLREAIAAANGTTAADTIKFDPALSGLITLTGGTLNITETLTIVGGGKITISGDNAVRIISVNNADTVKDHPLTVSGLTFVKGNAGGNNDGGSINSSEGMTILNCVFADNSAGDDGGAVRVSTSTGAVTVKDSHFADNIATSSGGGLYVNAAKGVTVTGSVFQGNSASSAGGAFVSSEFPAAKVTVSGCTFSYNHATGAAGGGLFISGNKVSVTNSQIVGNTAELNGGGMSLGGGNYTFTGLKVLGNSADQGGGISSVQGADSMILTKSLVEGNAATAGGGGGIYITSTGNGTAANISSTQIIGNTATGGSGGGILIFDTGGKISVTGSLVSGNTASSQGGGIAVHQNSPADLILTLTGNTVTANTANSAGGLSLFRYADFILSKNVISGNSATNTVGGVSFDVGGKVTFTKNQVVGNRAGNGIGGMDFVADADSTFTESGNVFAHNEGKTTGGLSILSAVDVTISKTTRIFGNIAGTTAKGGGVSAESSTGVIKLLGPVWGNHNKINASFDQTAGTLAGGPPPVPGVSANIVVTNLNNSGPGSLRQAIIEANGTPAADKIKFDDGLKGVITLTSTLEINSALTIYGRGQITLSGGGTTGILDINDDLIDDKDSPVTLSGLTFTKGAGTRGPAINVFETLTVLDCLFVDNDAGAFNGGAIFAELGLRTLTVKNSFFTGNDGNLGGAIFASSDKAITIANSVFASNTATESGGGARLVATSAAAKLSVTGSLFVGNTADVAGGGLSMRGFLDFGKFSKTSLATSIFASNSSSQMGGGLHLEQAAFTLTSVQLIKNTAATIGGGLYMSQGSTKQLTVSRSLIAENDGGTVGGGGVYLGSNAAGFAATFTATQILGNFTSNGSGGGIHANSIGGKLTVTGSLLANNEANTGGGLETSGTLNEATAVVLSGNTIIGNTADTGAGFSLGGDGALALTKNLILANHANVGGGGGILQSIAAITLKTNSVIGNRGDNTIGGLIIQGPATATFSTSGDIIAFNEGNTTGGLQIAGSIAGVIAKNTKITGNIGSGAIYGGGVTQDSSNSVKLLATVLGNLNRTNPARNDTFGLFA